MARPWIFSETRLLAQNPIKVVYVSHGYDGGAYIRPSLLDPRFFFCFLGRLPQHRMEDAEFVQRLRKS